jgi:hypothetical protein
MLPFRTDPLNDFFGNSLKVGDKVWVIFSEEPNSYSGVEERYFHLGEITYVEHINEHGLDAVLRVDVFELSEKMREKDNSHFKNTKATSINMASELIKVNRNSPNTEKLNNLAAAFSNQSTEFNEEDL